MNRSLLALRGCVASIIALTLLVSCDRAKKADQDKQIDALKKQVEDLQTRVEATPVPTPEEPKKQSIAGTVFYRKGSGDSLVLRSLEVFLFTPEQAGSKYVPSSERTVVDTFDHVAGVEPIKFKLIWSARGIDGDDGSNLLRRAGGILDSLAKYLPTAERKETTDVNGKFSFEDVPVGKYHLVAMLDTSTAKGFWYVEVSVDKGKILTVDLNNSNITEVWDIESEK